jgi:hypothetical protein
MRSGVIARVCLVAVALVVVAWLVVMERDAHLLANGTALAQKLTSKEKDVCPRAPAGTADCRGFARAVSDLRAARFLNPDTAPQLNLGIVLAGNDAKLRVASARRLTRSEPENLGAWLELLVASLHAQDLATSRDAAAALHRLDPRDFDSKGQLLRG